MSEVARISAQETRGNVSSGQALLVCAYDSDEKFARFHLEGAISLSEFKRGLDTLPGDREIVFY